MNRFGRHVPSSRPSISHTSRETHRIFCSLEDLLRLRLSAKTLELPSTRRANKTMGGQHRSNHRGRGMEFAEVRLYQPGDDVRAIDWRVTARRQKPHIKLFHEERERPVLILCDQGKSMFFGSRTAFKSVIAAELSGLLAWMAESKGDRTGGIVTTVDHSLAFRPSKSRKGTLRFLHGVAQSNQSLGDSFQHPQQPTFNVALRELKQLAHPGTLIVLISDFLQLDEQSHQLLTLLARHCELAAFRVFDPLETTLPPPGEYPVSDGKNICTLPANDKQWAERYLALVRQREDALTSLFLSLNSRLTPVSTQDDPVTVLTGFNRLLFR